MTSRSQPPEIGQRLAAARLQRGLSQKDVARRAGVAASYLSRVENGKVEPSFRTAMRLARTLDARPEELFGPEAPAPGGRGPCPVTHQGVCLLDLIAPHPQEGRYSPQEVRLIKRFATWIQGAGPSRMRAMEVLLADLTAARDTGENP